MRVLVWTKFAKALGCKFSAKAFTSDVQHNAKNFNALKEF